MMGVYIQGTAAISPQPTWAAESLVEPVFYQGNRLRCIEPDYATWMDLKQLRRMSRIMKIGAATAMLALKNATVTQPDAIITGTGWGCLDDTGIFLDRIVNNQEEALNPTPFIQSTHNTIGSHLAFLLQCQGYNQTYSHGAFSFESALLDSMLQLAEFPQQNILVGGADEITDVSHAIQSRFGVFKKENNNSLNVIRSGTKGTLHGEGSAWFVLSNEPNKENIKIEGVKTIYHSKNSIEENITAFLSVHGLDNENVDFVLLGKSGDSRLDGQMENRLATLLKTSSTGVFKHLCGEYPVASSFALWLAYTILSSGKVAPTVFENDRKRKIKTVLIYNQYFEDHHSLILLKRDDV